MRVFVTGATGWVGSVLVDELLGVGHQVQGLARSENKAKELAAKGAEVLHGTLDDLARLAAAAADADATIHLAFNHDFSTYVENSEQDRCAIVAMGEALIGTDKPILVTAGLAQLAPGRLATEADMPAFSDPNYPRRTEAAASALAERGVRVGAVPLATTVHGVGDQGLMATLARFAREKGVSAYIGDGANRWPAVHVSDAGRVYRLALEAGVPVRAYHATAEEGVRSATSPRRLAARWTCRLTPARASILGVSPPSSEPTHRLQAPGRANSPVGRPPGRPCSPIWSSPAISPDELARPENLSRTRSPGGRTRRSADWSTPIVLRPSAPI